VPRQRPATASTGSSGSENQARVLLAALFTFGLGELSQRDQTPSRLEAVAPHEAVELVGARPGVTETIYRRVPSRSAFGFHGRLGGLEADFRMLPITERLGC